MILTSLAVLGNAGHADYGGNLGSGEGGLGDYGGSYAELGGNKIGPGPGGNLGGYKN